MVTRILGVVATLLLGSCCALAREDSRGGDLERFGGGVGGLETLW